MCPNPNHRALAAMWQTPSPTCSVQARGRRGAGPRGTRDALQNQDAHHRLRRAPAQRTHRTGRYAVNLGRQRPQVNVRLDLGEWITERVDRFHRAALRLIQDDVILPRAEAVKFFEVPSRAIRKKPAGNDAIIWRRGKKSSPYVLNSQKPHPKYQKYVAIQGNSSNQTKSNQQITSSRIFKKLDSAAITHRLYVNTFPSQKNPITRKCQVPLP